VPARPVDRKVRRHGAAHVESFLTHLASERDVAASTQNQAQSALLFLYREVLARDLPWLDNVVRAKAPMRMPVVLTRGEVMRLLASRQGSHRLFGELLYGTGLRITCRTSDDDEKTRGTSRVPLVLNPLSESRRARHAFLLAACTSWPNQSQFSAPPV
jgi:site-specific recombinase XerD